VVQVWHLISVDIINKSGVGDLLNRVKRSCKVWRAIQKHYYYANTASILQTSFNRSKSWALNSEVQQELNPGQTFVLICLSVSVRLMDELTSLADILVWAPCRAGKNFEWRRAGFLQPNLGATSLVILKYGSCSKNHLSAT